MSAIFFVTRRRPGDAQIDLLELRVAHAVMLRDLRRLSALGAAIAARTQRCDRRRAGAVASYVGKVMDSVHEHHSAEDEVLWPVIAASAGDAIDLKELFRRPFGPRPTHRTDPCSGR